MTRRPAELSRTSSSSCSSWLAKTCFWNQHTKWEGLNDQFQYNTCCAISNNCLLKHKEITLIYICQGSRGNMMFGSAVNEVKTELTVSLLQEKSQVWFADSDIPSMLYVTWPSLWVTLQGSCWAAATVRQVAADKEPHGTGASCLHHLTEIKCFTVTFGCGFTFVKNQDT